MGQISGHDDTDRATASVAVVGLSLAMADAYATTAFALGARGPEWASGQPGYGVFAITGDGRTSWSDDVARLLARGHDGR